VNEPARHLLGIQRRVGFADRLDERLPSFEPRSQRANPSLEPGGEIGTTSTAPGGIGKVRLAEIGVTARRGGALSPSKLAKYTMKPLRLRRVIAYDERLQHSPRN